MMCIVCGVLYCVICIVYCILTHRRIVNTLLHASPYCRVPGRAACNAQLGIGRGGARGGGEGGTS